MDRGYRKGQERWNIRSDTGLRRELVRFQENSRVRDGDAWRCQYPADIPARVWYRMPLWIMLDTEPPITSSRLYLAQSREGCRCHDRLYIPTYENM